MTKRYRQEGVSPGVTLLEDVPDLSDAERLEVTAELQRLGITGEVARAFQHSAYQSLIFVHGLTTTANANPGVPETVEQVEKAQAVIEAFKTLMTADLPPALSFLPGYFSSQEAIALQCERAMLKLEKLRSHAEGAGGTGGRDAKAHRVELFDQFRRAVRRHGGNVSEAYQEQAFGRIFSLYLGRLEDSPPRNVINTTRDRWIDEGREAALLDEDAGHPAAVARRQLAGRHLKLREALTTLRTRRAHLGARLRAIGHAPPMHLPEIFPERGE